MTARQNAMAWWNDLLSGTKAYYGRLYYKRDYKTLTGREIEFIHKDEIDNKKERE